MVQRLPMVQCKAHARGFGSAAVGSLVWDLKRPSTKMGPWPLVFGGRHLIKQRNNQPSVSVSGGRDFDEEARPGWSMWGTPSHCLG